MRCTLKSDFFITIIFVCFIFLGIIASLCILASSNEQLLTLYYFLLFIVNLIGTQLLNIYSTPGLLKREEYFQEIVTSFSLTGVMVSWIVYAFFIVIYAFAFQSLKPVFMALCLFPVLRRYLNESYDDPTFLDSVAFGVVVFISLKTTQKLIIQLVDLVKEQFRIFTIRFRMYGALVLFVLHWRRLRLNSVLSLYWVVMWNYQMVIFTIFVDEKFHLSFILACAAYACNSFIKVSSLCYVILHIMKILLKAVHEIVKDDHTFVEEGQHRPTGLRESLGFLFLSLYTSLTSIDSSKRIVLLELIFLLLLSAMIRSVFEIVEPYILALNGTIVHSRRRHVHLVSFCVALMLLSLYMGLHLYQLREKIPFTLPNIITVAHILCALVLYFLYMYDSHKGGLWEELDDYVYYIKGTCRTFEFILIVLLLGYRVLDTTSKWTGFQIIMVIVHLYINVYLSLRDGWRSFQLRRLVNRRLNVLPQASVERLTTSEDVCPICLDELKSARVTPCNHLFHRFCLKKWLNVQNKCPMCHSVILKTD